MKNYLRILTIVLIAIYFKVDDAYSSPLADQFAPILHLSSGRNGKYVNLKGSTYPYTDYIPINAQDLLNDTEAKNYIFQDTDTEQPDKVFRDFYTRIELKPAVHFKEFENKFYKNPIAIQYWFYYFYNSWERDHKSDWESSTFFLDENKSLKEGSYSTHYEANRVPLSATPTVVYVSNGGHGSYPTSGEDQYIFGTDFHHGDAENITDYTLIDLNAASEILSQRGKWGTGNAPVGPLGRNDIPFFYLGFTKNVQSVDPYKNCNSTTSKLFGENNFPKSLENFSSNEEIEKATLDIQKYGPWKWAISYPINNGGCNKIDKPSKFDLGKSPIDGINPVFSWKKSDAALGYTIKISERKASILNLGKKLLASKIVPNNKETCDDDGNCSATLNLDFKSSQMCWTVEAWNPAGKFINDEVCPTKVTFVIDDTGSMSEEISAVKNSLANYIESHKDSFSSMNIITFKDDITDRITSNNSDEILEAINSITASGGDDCPELSFQAIDYALDNISENGTIIFATDASSQAGVSLPTLQKKADEKKVKIAAFLTGTCPNDTSGTVTDAVKYIERYQQQQLISNKTKKLLSENIQNDYTPPGALPESANSLDVDGPIESHAFISSDINYNPQYFASFLYEGKTYTLDVRKEIIDPFLLFQFIDSDGATVLQEDSVGSNYFSNRLVIKPGRSGYYYVKITTTYPSLFSYFVSINEDPNATKVIGLDAYKKLSESTGGKFIYDPTGDTSKLEQLLVDALNEATTPSILNTTPNQVAQGTGNIIITLTGENTNWDTNSLVTLQGDGINVISVTAISTTTIQVVISVSEQASTGFRDVTVLTDGKSVTKEKAIEITSKPSTTTFTGSSVTGSGQVTAQIPGKSGCSFSQASLTPVSSIQTPPPDGYTFPHGLFTFAVTGCTNGALILQITYPQALPTDTKYWKYGKTPDNHTPHWYELLAATISGNQVTLAIADGGLGDDDLTANGTIVDDGGPGRLAAAPGVNVPIPTLSEWALLLLGFSLMLIIWRLTSTRFPPPSKP